MTGYALTGYGAPDGYLWRPRSPRQGKRGIVLCGGVNWTALNFVPTVPGETGDYNVGNVGAGTLVAALAHIGFTLICPNASGLTFGDDAVVGSGGLIDTAATAMQAACSYLATDKILTLGISMGGTAQARYMLKQPSKCAGAVMILPLVNLTGFYNTNQGGYQSQIATDYGVTAPAALPSAADPTANAAAIATSGPIRLFTSDATSNTTTGVTKADCDAFTAAVNAAGGSCTQTICDSTDGHSDLTTAKVDVPTVAKFLAANGC